MLVNEEVMVAKTPVGQTPDTYPKVMVAKTPVGQTPDTYAKEILAQKTGPIAVAQFARHFHFGIAHRCAHTT